MSASRTRAEKRRSFERSIALVLIALFGLACPSDNERESRTPSASFSQEPAGGAPGDSIQFNDTSTGDITSYAWDFGSAGSSSEQNPQMTFPEVGTFSVELTVSGPRGTSSVSAPVEIAEPPIAGFTCTPTIGFAPLTVACTDESVGAERITWNFGDGSEPSTQRIAVHTYTTAAAPTLTLEASNAGGVDQASTAIGVLAIGLASNPSSGSGSAPLLVTFTAETGGLDGLFIWTVEGQITIGGRTLQHRFNNPGTFRVAFDYVNLNTGLLGSSAIEYVVDYGPASAAFAPSVSGGSGPLQVTLMDDSTGAIDRWEWSFGDGTQCVFPAPSDPDPDNPIATCDSSSPSHVYDEVGNYSVTLTITGPGENQDEDPISSTTTLANAVRVYIVDASFELQATNSQIGDPWTHLRPADALEAAEHIALARQQGADAGMPTHGARWAALDGLGTDGSTAVDAIENGIRQEFLRPLEETVLEFDYVLLYSEPPASLMLDAVTATVSDGTTTVEIPSARANVSSPYAGPSTRFPLRDGSEVRVTPVLTAGIDLLDAFPAATEQTRFTLTIRTANAVNEFRSPRVYVDNIRFVEPGDALFAEFVLDTDPVIAGQPASLTDQSCLDPGTGACSVPTSWRWDFDTHLLATPPTASGSADQNPSYSFPEAGLYEVRLLTRLAELEATTSLQVVVVDKPTAAFGLDPEGPYSAPATLTFGDLSTSDPDDPITVWSWDFGGWGVSSLQNPAPVTIGQAGDWVVRLSVTTASGQTDTSQTIVTVE